MQKRQAAEEAARQAQEEARRREEEALKLSLIDLNNLRPLERLLWDLRDTKLTDPQLLTKIESAGLRIEDHPAFEMVMNCPHREEHIRCDHVSHDTQEKENRCIRQQAAKMAVRTVRNHLGFLERFALWSEPRSLMQNAMWTCIERKQQACPQCREREGIVESTRQRVVRILHPGCNCSLVQLCKGQEIKSIARSVRHLQQRNPERAATMTRNAARSGFSPQAAGCATILFTLTVIAGVTVILINQL